MEGKILGVNITFRTGRVSYAVPYSVLAPQVAEWKSRLAGPMPPTPTATLSPTVRPRPTATPVSPWLKVASGTGNGEHFWEIPEGTYAIELSVEDNQDKPLTISVKHVTREDGWVTHLPSVDSANYAFLVFAVPTGGIISGGEFHAGRQLLSVEATGSWVVSIKPHG